MDINHSRARLTSRRDRIRRGVLASACALGLWGCATTHQYRDALEYSSGPDVAADAPPSASPVGLSGPGYQLGVIEFDDQGELLGMPPQYEFVRSAVTGESQAQDYRGKIVVVFAHGWFHDARPQDQNLELERTLLAMLATNERSVAGAESRLPRMVEGVFLAWRGANLELPGVSYLTFWNRKDTAHRIGERRVTEVILGLRDAAYGGSVNAATDVPNRFILMGHSFGGALVYSATSQLIANHLLEHPGETAPRSPLADAIFLFNPAFEAAQIAHLLDTAAKLGERLPTLSIFTSKSDSATGIAFPAARFLDTLFESYRDAIDNPIRPGTTYSEREADTRTVGHFAPFLTHDLVRASADGSACRIDDSLQTHSYEDVAPTGGAVTASASGAKASALDQGQSRLMEAYTQSASVLNFGETCLVQRPGLVRSQLAAFNVSMDADVWDGHGIEQTPDRTRLMLEFLEHFVPFAAASEEIPAGIATPEDHPASQGSTATKKIVGSRRPRARF